MLVGPDSLPIRVKSGHVYKIGVSLHYLLLFQTFKFILFKLREIQQLIMVKISILRILQIFVLLVVRAMPFSSIL